MKVKAKPGFKKLENKFFGIHKSHRLVCGGVIEVTDFDSIPEDVRNELEEVKPKVKKKKGDK